MKLRRIFVKPKPTLYSIQYGDNINEYRRLFDFWHNSLELKNFFTEHQGDITGRYNMSIREAVNKVKNEAKVLEAQIEYCVKYGHEDIGESLQNLFKPLDNNETSLPNLQKTKSKPKTRIKPFWIRLYGIRIAPNLIVISGGAIKLTDRMDEREHTRKELIKLNRTLSFLKENNLIDSDDFEFLES